MKLRPWNLWLLSTPLLLVAFVAPIATTGFQQSIMTIPGFFVAMHVVFGTLFSLGSLFSQHFLNDDLFNCGWSLLFLAILITPYLVQRRQPRNVPLHAALCAVCIILFAAMPLTLLSEPKREIIDFCWGMLVFLSYLAINILSLLLKLLHTLAPFSTAQRRANALEAYAVPQRKRT